MTLHVTSPPYLDARDADSAPESTNPDSMAESPPSSA